MQVQKPLIYLITNGATTLETTPVSDGFVRVLDLVHAATAAGVDLIQIREKDLTANVLYELTRRASEITGQSATRLLVNDRADVAKTAGADGVHLTTRSLDAAVIRRTFGDDFLIGVSTHSLAEVRAACEKEVSFIVYGPVFETASKAAYGDPVGVGKLGEVAAAGAPLPVLALGGITLNNVEDCARAGAGGIAAIRLLSNPASLLETVKRIRQEFGGRLA